MSWNDIASLSPVWSVWAVHSCQGSANIWQFATGILSTAALPPFYVSQRAGCLVLRWRALAAARGSAVGGSCCGAGAVFQSVMISLRIVYGALQLL